jgi:predicted DNA-binding transcriptional regulator YafY
MVLGFGSAVRVVEPESLRQGIEDEARAVADAARRRDLINRP